MDWKFADYISDKIVDLLNSESSNPDFSPTQMFAGQMCAMLAMIRTAGDIRAPQEFRLVQVAIERCLQSMLSETPVIHSCHSAAETEQGKQA